jgi:hypothetical protein
MIIEGKGVYLSLAHRYWDTRLGNEENQALYGDDASPDGVGGNLRLEAFIRHDQMAPHPDLTAHLDAVKRLVDHHSLFDDIVEFRESASTLERMAQYLGGKLFALPLQTGAWSSVVLWEGERLRTEVRPGQASLILGFKVRDLWLEVEGPVDGRSGLVQNRQEVFRIAEQTYANSLKQDLSKNPEWLFNQLQLQLKSLVSVRVDLGRQKFLGLRAGT